MGTGSGRRLINNISPSCSSQTRTIGPFPLLRSGGLHNVFSLSACLREFLNFDIDTVCVCTIFAYECTYYVLLSYYCLLFCLWRKPTCILHYHHNSYQVVSPVNMDACKKIFSLMTSSKDLCHLIKPYIVYLVNIDVKIEQLLYSMTESKCGSVLRIQYSPNLWSQPVLYLCVVMYLCVPAYYSRYSYHHRPDMETRSCIILYSSIFLRWWRM